MHLRYHHAITNAIIGRQDPDEANMYWASENTDNNIRTERRWTSSKRENRNCHSIMAATNAWPE